MALITKKLILIILIGLALITISIQNNCKETPQFEEQCICAPYEAVCNNMNNQSPIHWKHHITNTLYGEVEFVFLNITFCKDKKYTVKLYVNEDITDPLICSASKIMSFRSLHSGIQLMECSSNCKNISGDISTTFNYIFTGCYIIIIMAGNKHNSLFPGNKGIISNPTFISTEYKKDLNATTFELLRPSFSHSFNATKIEIAFNSSNITKVPNIIMKLLKIDCKQNCTLHSVTKIIPNNQSITENFTRCKQPHDVIWNCSYNFVNRISYSCYYFDLKPGFYNLKVKLWDIRCNIASLWNSDFCSGNKNISITIPQAIEKKIEIPRYEIQTYVYVVIAFLILIILICLLYCTYKKLYSRKETQPALSILIVYARDHWLFKEVIKEFKQVLSSPANTRVFDIADELDLWEDRDRIENINRNTHTKIIFFVNKCAIALDYSEYSINYIKSDCQDNNFKYAMTQLKKGDLENLYMIGIKKSDLYKFDYLKSKKAYVMPCKVDNLLKRVFTKNTQIDKQLLTNFKNKINEYKDFTQGNPHYYNLVLCTQSPK